MQMWTFTVVLCIVCWIFRHLFTLRFFAAARIVGWSAHRLEELKNVDKIIRPAYKPLSPYREYVKMEDR